MADKMWFGHARGHMQYVPCPLIDSSVTRNRYLERIQFENGGGDGRRSNQYQMQYDFAFSGLAHEVDGIDAFNKYAQGFYGDDLIHLAHPAAFETNLFPAGWATPSLSEKGWGKISSDAVAYSNADGPMYTNLVTNPSMEGVTAGTDSTKRTNLCTNPSFETDLTGWTISGVTGTRDTTTFYSGTASLKIVTPGSAGNEGTYSSTAAPGGLIAGSLFSASVWVKAPAGATMEFYATSLGAGNVFKQTIFTGTGSWQLVKAEGATLGASVNPYVVVRTGATAQAITFYVDAVIIESGSKVGDYFDGNYSEDRTLIPAWTGTVNNSTSTALVRGASNRENLITNPSFEVNTAGWAAGSNATISRVTTEAYVGAASMQIAATANDGYASLGSAPATVSSTYTLSVWVKGEIGKAVYIGIGDNVNTTYSSALTMTGAWQRITYTKTVSATTTYCFPIIRNGSSSGVHTFYVDAVMLEQSTKVNPYFDGSYTDAPGWTTSWAGTANASRSIATAAPVTVRTNLVTNPSMESVTSGTVVMRRNLSENPRMVVTGVYPAPNYATITITKNVAVPAPHPLGITTCAESINTLANSRVLLSIYGADGRINTGSIQRTLGAWVYVNEAGYQVGGYDGWSATPLTANTWTWIQQNTANAAGAWVSLEIIKTTGLTSTTARAYITGVIAEAGSTVGNFFDGSTTDALGWDYAWSGTANASISTAACAATTVRTNLVTNPSVEVDTTGWTTSGGTIARVTTQAYVGTASLQLTANSYNGALYDVASVTASQTYTSSVWVKGTAGDTALLELSERTSGGTTVGTTSGTVTTLTGSWQRLTVTRTFGSTGVNARLIIRNTSATSSPTYWDALMLEASSTAGDYFDGSFSPAGDFSYAWTGTANASTSIARGATVTGAANFLNTSYQSRSNSYVGSNSLAMFYPSDSISGTYFDYTVTPSATYTVSAWMKGTAGKPGQLSFEERTSGGAGVGATGASVTFTGSWQRVTVTRTFSSTGAIARVVFYNGSSTFASQTIYVDAVLLEASPIVQDYFDGSVVSADADLTNSWSGTPHASTSLMRGVGATGYSDYIATPISSTSWASTGTKSLRVIPKTSENLSLAYVNVTSVVGQTYTLQAKIRLAAAQTGTLDSKARRLVVQVGGSFPAMSAAAPNAAGVTTLTVTYTATTTSFAVLLFNGASAGNGDVWWDDLMVVAGTYTGDYFDGNSTDSGNTTYSWTGTANASTSTSLSEMVLYGNPPRATTYTVTNINQPPTKVCTLVIPPEYTLYLGASGTYTGSAGVFIRPIQASDSLYYGQIEELTLLDPNGSVRMNKTLNGVTYQAVEIFLMKTDAAAATVTLNSMMAQLYKTGTTPALPTNHYQGEGSTGLMFADDAIVETYSYMHPPRKGISTKLIEVEAWR